MIYSMTGYGKSVRETKDKKITVELKSLNSKQLDIYCKIPNYYKAKELNLRNEIAHHLFRGKIELAIHVDFTSGLTRSTINQNIVKNYFYQLEKVAFDLKIENRENFLPIIMRLPDALQTEDQDIDEDEWHTVTQALYEAISELKDFRKQEGTAMEKDIKQRISMIKQLQEEIPNYENDRIQKIKTRLRNNLKEFIEKENIDENRFEQEIIYYLEKFDLTEEKVRLINHCNYFLDTLSKENLQGKKLSFIAQEILREINTIGSKANESNIQRLVVNMKDETEKIKEQIMNVL